MFEREKVDRGFNRTRKMKWTLKEIADEERSKSIRVWVNYNKININ